MRHVDRGFEIVESDTSRIVLLGVEPNDPDPEYGYIVPGEMINDSGFGARTAQLFVEKPAAEAAKKLISCGALWNTMVVISSAATLLSAVGAALPELYHAFAPISEAIGSTHERQII